MDPDTPYKPLLWLVALGVFMQMLDSTIVNTALPAMAASLGESPLRMQSVVIAYSLTMAMLIPASGWLADRFGTRRVYFAAIVLFEISAVDPDVCRPPTPIGECRLKELEFPEIVLLKMLTTVVEPPDCSTPPTSTS